jgi:TRAP-type C4-dicarboxylate transport system substrate-binding protein
MSADDQAVVREVMTAIYARFDAANLIDNRGARDALVNSGIEAVEFDADEYSRVRRIMEKSNRDLGARGEFTVELYNEMIGHIEEYRSEHH